MLISSWNTLTGTLRLTKHLGTPWPRHINLTVTCALPEIAHHEEWDLIMHSLPQGSPCNTSHAQLYLAMANAKMGYVWGCVINSWFTKKYPACIPSVSKAAMLVRGLSYLCWAKSYHHQGHWSMRCLDCQSTFGKWKGGQDEVGKGGECGRGRKINREWRKWRKREGKWGKEERKMRKGREEKRKRGRKRKSRGSKKGSRAG